MSTRNGRKARQLAMARLGSPLGASLCRKPSPVSFASHTLTGPTPVETRGRWMEWETKNQDEKNRKTTTTKAAPRLLELTRRGGDLRCQTGARGQRSRRSSRASGPTETGNMAVAHAEKAQKKEGCKTNQTQNHPALLPFFLFRGLQRASIPPVSRGLYSSIPHLPGPRARANGGRWEAKHGG